MKTLELDQRCQVLSAGDGEIAGALQALDDQLRAWLSAMQYCETYLSSVGIATHDAPLPPEEPALAVNTVAPAVGGVVDEVVDEEALLASLDPELANTVRVKRRLSGKRTDIRELIREVEASLDTKRKKSRRSPWWS